MKSITLCVAVCAIALAGFSGMVEYATFVLRGCARIAGGSAAFSHGPAHPRLRRFR